MAETYRAKAAEFRAKAETETEPIVRTEYERLVKWYLRLAEQAERNAKTDLTYETPPRRDANPPA